MNSEKFPDASNALNVTRRVKERVRSPFGIRTLSCVMYFVEGYYMVCRSKCNNDCELVITEW